MTLTFVFVAPTIEICLKNRTFAVPQTTIILADIKTTCCDLLEKSYICSIANNRMGITDHEEVVVICLKNRTFAVSQTTYNRAVQWCIAL